MLDAVSYLYCKLWSSSHAFNYITPAHELKRSDSFRKLTPAEQKDLLRLLLKDILYDGQQGKIKLTLRQLPDLGVEVIDGKVSFDERQVWLPELCNNQNFPLEGCHGACATQGELPSTRRS